MRQASHVILPGVGAFADAMAELRRTGLGEAFVEAVRAGKPCLGVCLGLQLLFDTSSEDGDHTGLGLLPGRVVRFAPRPGLKIPHMGWNTLRTAARAPASAAWTRALGLLRSLLPCLRPIDAEDVAADGRLSRSLRRHRLARQPDGLPVPSREEPARRAGDVCQFRPICEFPIPSASISDRSVLAMLRVQGYIESSLKNLCRSGERSCK